MIWLRRLLFRRIVKGFENRLASLRTLMDSAVEHKRKLNDQLEKLQDENPVPTESIDTIREQLETWTRIYWDAWVRHEEVESGLMWVLKDFDRR
jgi:hypothetical protein